MKTLPRDAWIPCPICVSDYDGVFCHACRNTPSPAQGTPDPPKKAIEFWREHSNSDASPDWTKFSAEVRQKLDSISVEILSCAFAAEEMRGELFAAKYMERNVRWNRAMVMIAELLEAALAGPQNGQGWVRVQERMPNEQEVAAHNGWFQVANETTGRQDVAKLIKGKDFMGHALQFNDITHWQNLAAPPTGDAPHKEKT